MITPSAPPFGISTSAVMLCAPVEDFDRDVFRHHLRVPDSRRSVLRSWVSCGRSSAKRIVPRLSSGKTLYLPASAYQSAIISISLSRLASARLLVSAGSFDEVVELPALGVQLAQLVFGQISSPKKASASREDGPGNGQTARHPS